MRGILPLWNATDLKGKKCIIFIAIVVICTCFILLHNRESPEELRYKELPVEVRLGLSNLLKISAVQRYFRGYDGPNGTSNSTSGLNEKYSKDKSFLTMVTLLDYALEDNFQVLEKNKSYLTDMEKLCFENVKDYRKKYPLHINVIAGTNEQLYKFYP